MCARRATSRDLTGGFPGSLLNQRSLSQASPMGNATETRPAHQVPTLTSLTPVPGHPSKPADAAGARGSHAGVGCALRPCIEAVEPEPYQPYNWAVTEPLSPREPDGRAARVPGRWTRQSVGACFAAAAAFFFTHDVVFDFYWHTVPYYAYRATVLTSLLVAVVAHPLARRWLGRLP